MAARDYAAKYGFINDIPSTLFVFVSAFGEKHEGHISPMYRITGSPHGALHRGFRRFIDELRRTARRVI